MIHKNILFFLFIIFEQSHEQYLEQRSDDCLSNPNTIKLTISEMCSLPPERGHGLRDIVRIYYNPVLQQCLPFSWSGTAGNANRFVSIKNCYELCHPSDPQIRKLSGSGLRPYLVARRPPVYCSDQNAFQSLDTTTQQSSNGQQQDVMVRQIDNPLDLDKTLTLIQPVRYVIGSTTSSTPRPKVVIEKRIRYQPFYYQSLNQCQ